MKMAWAPKASPKTVANASTSNNGGNGNSNNNNQVKPTYGGNNSRPPITLSEMKNKPYSFRRDKVEKIFRDAMNNGLRLPESKRPGDMEKSDDPNFCPYHRLLGHPIEDCWVFKDWVERKYKAGEITLSKNVLQDAAPHEQANMVAHSNPEEENSLASPWVIHMSKKARKLLKKLQKEPGVKWKNTITTVVPETSQKPQAFYKKKGSNASQKKRSKKPLKPVELPEETGLKKYRKALEEYEQGKPMPTILQDFIPEKIMKALLGLKNEEENSEGEDEFWVETCHSITHIEESCNTIHYGSDSEEESLSLEELFFFPKRGKMPIWRKQ